MSRPIGGNPSPRQPTGWSGSTLVPAAQIALLRESFAVVAAQSDIAALVFYRHLFTLDPSLKVLFHTSIELQGRKLMEALEFTLATLANPGELVPVLEALGRRHVTYGAKHDHYATVTQAMLLTLNETLGNQFTSPTAFVREQALGFVCETMQRGANDVEELVSGKPTKPPASKTVRSPRVGHR